VNVVDAVIHMDLITTDLLIVTVVILAIRIQATDTNMVSQVIQQEEVRITELTITYLRQAIVQVGQHIQQELEQLKTILITQFLLFLFQHINILEEVMLLTIMVIHRSTVIQPIMDQGLELQEQVINIILETTITVIITLIQIVTMDQMVVAL